MMEALGYLGHDIKISRGDVVLLRGPNGSGKTSLLRSLAGLDAPLRPALLRPDPAALPARALRDALALSPQDARDALAGLTVGGEFRLRGRRAPDVLSPLEERESATLSSGESRRVALALAEGAPLLLLDEPAEGLDPEGRDRLRALVQAAAARGAVVAADHGDVLDDLATRVVHLGPLHPAALPPIPRREGAPILADPALGPGFHALRGPNGCGKSTLLRRLAREPGTRLLLPHARDMLTRERVADEIAGAEDLGLVPPALQERHPLTLSGGEAQRVALAKALGSPARCYLLDEPEAHLDAEGRRALALAIARRVSEGACVLAATHDDALSALAQSEVRL